MSLAEAGYAIGAVKGPTGIIGLLAGGLVADRLDKRSLGGGIRIVGGLMVLAAAFAIATVNVPSWTLPLVFIGCLNFLNHNYYGATFATYLTLAPVRSEEHTSELQTLMSNSNAVLHIKHTTK